MTLTSGLSVQKRLGHYAISLINAVKIKTDYCVVINTSFTLHGRTMMHPPADAVTDFIDCNIDELYIEGFKVERNK